MMNRSISSLVLFAGALPLLLVTYFYLWVPSHAWFFADDFQLMAAYTGGLHFEQLLNFDNLGRFISRNLYWHIGCLAFHAESAYYYLVNLFVITASGFLIFLFIEKILDTYSGVLLGLAYYILPPTLVAYTWISNSQHLIAHFFVLAFVWLYLESVRSGLTGTRQVALTVIYCAGILANILAGLVVVLPLVYALFHQPFRVNWLHRAFLVLALSVLAVFIVKSARFDTGVYATRYDLETLLDNVRFYFGYVWIFMAWVVAVIVGFVYSCRARVLAAAGFFACSGAFFVPFAFQTHQRYLQYAALMYLFFLFGSYYLLKKRLRNRAGLNAAVSVAVLYALLAGDLPQIQNFSQGIWGERERNVVDLVRGLDHQGGARAVSYCFGAMADDPVLVSEARSMWIALGRGDAFRIFVSPAKSYRLGFDDGACDVRFGLNSRGAVLVGSSSE